MSHITLEPFEIHPCAQVNVSPMSEGISAKNRIRGKAMLPAVKTVSFEGAEATCQGIKAISAKTFISGN